MRYNKYSATKQTNRQWLGNIPSDWSVVTLKRLGKTITGGTPKTDNLAFWDGGTIPWLPSGKVQNAILQIEDADTYITESAVKNSAAKIIKPNSVLVALTGATCGNIGHLTFESTANQSVVALEPQEYINSKFIYYSLLAQREQITVKKSGGAQGGITTDDVRNLFVCLPRTVNEQDKIASFLDFETNKIDMLVEKQLNLMNVLVEMREAIITHAVSGGLSVDNRRKPSKFPWFNHIPDTWIETKISRVSARVTDGAHISPDLSEEKYPFVSTVDISKSGKIDFDGCIKTSENCYSSLVKNGCKPFLGDVLFSKDGTIGRTAIIDFEHDFVVASSLVIITPEPTQLNSRFLNYWLNNSIIKQEIGLQLGGAALKRISIDKISRLPILLPSLKEQEEICEILDSKISKIEDLFNKAKFSIGLLKEHRKSLISAAVTGKIDVRNMDS